jgi:predicted MFS family arabinose efflux permease
MTIHKLIFLTYKDAYAGLPRSAWILSLVEFINRSGSMVLFFMTLYLTQAFGFSPLKAGQAISGYGLGALLGSYLGGKLSDAMGAYRVQKISLVLTGIGYILLGQLTAYPAILIMMFFIGMASEALHPSNATAMSQVCAPKVRTKGFALNRLASNLGVTIGPPLGGFLAMSDYKLLFWVDGITCLVAYFIFAIFFKANRPPIGEKEINPASNQSPWKDFYFLKLLGFSFFIGLIFVQLFNTFPIYFRTVYQFRENLIGLLIAINTVMIVLFEMILINALKNKNQIKIIAFGLLLLAEGFALIPLGSGFLYGALTVMVWTTGEILAFPALTALIANISDDSTRGRYMGLFSFSFAFALFVGPTLGSKIYDNLGPDALWFGCGIAGIFIFFGFLSLNRKKLAKKIKHSENKISESP